MKEKLFKYAPIILLAVSSIIWLIAFLLHNIINFVTCIVSQGVLLVCCGIIMKQLHQQAIKDSLTGLYNRRFFLSKLREIPKADFPLALLMIDIDNFKKVNDTYGHLAGDEALKQVTEILTGNIRKSDWGARLGGEEFAIVLSRSDSENAYRLAERLRDIVENFDFSFEQNTIKMTISIGVATTYKCVSINDLLRLADMALYEAKEIRNTVIML
ncbi:diguanylate cyclase (GGDEF) domain-containing protein [Sporobacter termitidis DSM 10068]|uniref:Diguanylate cyclase (GGDEF) domain-containing protein n=1 Tax=Sporobacter termitidis DSM 10068 TaxID=1123282 RepID=A0A1M5VIR1_9FIRM|nr:GGDEF domain-containing protein [Sporobacter termitidis]SHH75085.1 diguanylate cyclase (GGDEF) domain-containing protein [Sporobacter termitidis DSM 10068]